MITKIIQSSDCNIRNTFYGYCPLLTCIEIDCLKEYVIKKYGIFYDLDISGSIPEFPYPNFEEISSMFDINNECNVNYQFDINNQNVVDYQFSTDEIQEFRLVISDGEESKSYSMFFNTSISDDMFEYLKLFTDKRSFYRYVQTVEHIDSEIKEIEKKFHFSFKFILEILMREEINNFLKENRIESAVRFIKEDQIYLDNSVVDTSEIDTSNFPKCFYIDQNKPKITAIILGGLLYAIDHSYHITQLNNISYHTSNNFFYFNSFEDKMIVFLYDNHSDLTIDNYVDKLIELFNTKNCKLYEISILYDNIEFVNNIDVGLYNFLKTEFPLIDDEPQLLRIVKTKTGFKKYTNKITFDEIDISYYKSRIDSYFRNNPDILNNINDVFNARFTTSLTI